jgi:hypothetical protein
MALDYVISMKGHLSEEPMACKSCESVDQRILPSEIAVHLPFVLGTPAAPHELVYSYLLVCLDCGFTEFVVPDDVRHRLTAS